MDTRKKKITRKPVSPLRLSEEERLALEFLSHELGLSLSAASRFSILDLARRMKHPGQGFDIIL